MRKMWAAGASVSLCLALGGVPVAAQEASPSAGPTVPTGPAVVTGTVNCQVVPCDYHGLNDPRVQGDADFVNLGCFAGGRVCRGTNTIKGPDGEWVGQVLYIPSKDLGDLIVLTFEGTGAYEGWAFVATAVEQGGPSPLNGVIYEGPAPSIEWPEP